jgi:hypothetical protein
MEGGSLHHRTAEAGSSRCRPVSRVVGRRPRLHPAVTPNTITGILQRSWPERLIDAGATRPTAAAPPARKPRRDRFSARLFRAGGEGGHQGHSSAGPTNVRAARKVLAEVAAKLNPN